MSNAFDDLARTLARPMPRRHMLRMLGGAVAVAAIPGLRARPAHAATGGLTCPPPTSVCTNGKGSELCQPDGGACCIFSYEIVVCPRGWRCGTEESPACVCDGTVDRTGACVQKCAAKDICGGSCCPEDRPFCCGTSREKGYCCGPEQAKTENKAICAKYSAEWNDLAANWAIGGAIMASLKGGGAIVGGLGSALAWKASSVLGICAADPPNRHFKSISKPKNIRLRSVPSGDTGSAGAAQALNALFANQAAAFELVRVWVGSLERGQGAALARDEAWSKKQTLAAAGYAAAAAAALKREPGLRHAARAALAASGFKDPHFGADDVQRFQNQVATTGLPASYVALLRTVGLTNPQISDVRARILKANHGQLTGSFLTSLTAPLFLQLPVQLAGELERFAKRAKAKPLGA